MSVKTWDELEKIAETIDGITVTMAELQAIVVTFWEGGSTHWIMLADIRHPTLISKPRGMATSEWAFDALLTGGHILITPNGNGERKYYTLTMENYRTGLKKFIAFDRDGRMYPAITSDVLDASQIDASDADSILQLSLFGEVVFG